jgi:pimeloyl-ACP methyl ester carboxylesterase
LHSFAYCEASQIVLEHKLPVSLDGQIEFAENLLKKHVQPDRRVILMGHSMGAYIFMEMIQRRRAQAKQAGTIIGAIGVFPGVVHLARSEGGQRAQQLRAIPGLAILAIFFVRLLSFLPTSSLLALVKMFLGYPEQAAMTTVCWIKKNFNVECY